MSKAVAEIPRSSLARMLKILDLFSDEHPTRAVEDVVIALEVSLPTAYRYVRTLLESGLLQRQDTSHYALGPRIILLDYYIRRADPVLRAALPVLRELVEATGLDCVLTELFGMRVLDTHREMGSRPAALSYGRGRPRPLFLGGAPKVLLASLGAGPLRKVFDARRKELVRCGLPSDLPAFRRYFAVIRRTGYYVSEGELEPRIAAVAAPVLKPAKGAWAAVSLVFDRSRLSIIDVEKMTRLVSEAAARIAGRLVAPLHPLPTEDSP